MASRNDSREPAIRPDSIPADWHYSGTELESMAFAVNYRRWILERLKPYLGKHLIEVGAGDGLFSELLLDTRPETFIPLEPSANRFPVLARRLLDIDGGKIAKPRRCSLGGLIAGEAPAPPADSIIYINVLEHIKDDTGELKTACSMLSPGGHVLIFAPANPWLMGSMDRLLEHCRRYTMNELTSKCSDAGFNIQYQAHFDVLGIVPWWLKYRVLKSEQMEPAFVRIYDRFVVPFARVLERRIPPPAGKNIIVVGRKL